MGAVAPMVTSNTRTPRRRAAWRGCNGAGAAFRVLITKYSSPRAPHRVEHNARVGICLMDKSTSGMDMWTRQSLDHMPTPAEPLPTGARPSGLTRFACPTFEKC